MGKSEKEAFANEIARECKIPDLSPQKFQDYYICMKRKNESETAGIIEISENMLL